VSIALAIALGAGFGCQSMSYEEPDAPPPTPRSYAPTTSSKAAGRDESWSSHANAARAALQQGELEEAEAEFIACMAATEEFDDRDVRRLTSLAIPAALVERRQADGDFDGATRIMDAVLAESQGGVAFPLDAWAQPLQTRLEVVRIQQGPEAELELARRIAEIHLGPLTDATIAEVRLRQQVAGVIGASGDFAAAATQLGWAARAAEPMLRLSIDERLALLYEAAEASARADDPTASDFLLREAVELAKRSAPDSLAEASALNQRGWFLVEQGHTHQSLPLLEAAARIVREQDAAPALEAATLDSLAVALHRAGRLEEASAVLDEAFEARAAATPEERAPLSVLDEHRASLDRDLSKLEAVPPAAAADAEPSAPPAADAPSARDQTTDG
jgi:hypothetical protein